MDVSIERVDQSELAESDVREIYLLERSAALEVTPEDGYWDEESFLKEFRHRPADWRATYVLARAGRELRGFARAGWRDSHENRHLAHTNVIVAAPHRRQGLGRRLLGEAAAAVEAAGRSLLMAEVSERAVAGTAFCSALGAAAGLVQHENRLDLSQVDRSLVERWLEPRPGYELVAVEGAIQPDMQAEAARVLEVMNDAPRGELQMEDEHESPEQMAAFEDMIAAAGNQMRTVFARHAESGRLAGFTRVSWHASMPTVVWQWGTGVDRSHRGHGLGRWMKAAMLDRILREWPSAERVSTSNATTNQWMLAINRELGFRPVASLTTWQLETAAVRYTSAQPARLLE